MYLPMVAPFSMKLHVPDFPAALSPWIRPKSLDFAVGDDRSSRSRHVGKVSRLPTQAEGHTSVFLEGVPRMLQRGATPL